VNKTLENDLLLLLLLLNGTEVKTEKMNKIRHCNWRSVWQLSVCDRLTC